MKSIPLRAVLFALIGLVALGSAVSLKPNTSESTDMKVTDGACTNSGITLVVDFGKAARESLVKCVRQFSGTGWQLFGASSIEVAGTAEYPESFVCRIAGFPSDEEEDCLGTPSFVSGTWVYFQSSVKNKSQGWLRSAEGSASRKPQCGDYEGWRFVIGQSNQDQLPRYDAKPFTCKQ